MEKWRFPGPRQAPSAKFHSHAPTCSLAGVTHSREGWGGERSQQAGDRRDVGGTQPCQLQAVMGGHWVEWRRGRMGRSEAYPHPPMVHIPGPLGW